MKGVVGVAGPRMSPATKAPLSNSRALIKQPFTGGVITAPLQTHTQHPASPPQPIEKQLPWPQRGGDPPFPPPSAGTPLGGERRRDGDEESNPSASWFLPAACPLPLSWHSQLQLQRPPETPQSKPQGKAHYGHNSSSVRPVLSGRNTSWFSPARRRRSLPLAHEKSRQAKNSRG